MNMYKKATSLLFILVVLFVPAVAQASTNDFVFSSFSANYYLGRDAENRSTLRVEETLVAQFPNFDQNHGIERAIPNVYDDHPVSLDITGVYKDDGSPWNFTTYSSNDNTVLRIGDADTYVQGSQTYLIKYTLRDVTRSFTEGDEFFWDTNGTEWLQPFASVKSTVYLDDSITTAFDGRLACFTGDFGSTTQDCTITNTDGTINATAMRPLNAGENLSIVVGFAPDTFGAYIAPPTPLWLLLFIFIVVPIFYILVPILLLIWGIKKWRSQGRDVIKQSTIIPQYLPPKDVSMLRADVLIHTTMQAKAVSATIIDLAVKHYLKIYEVEDKEYELEINKDSNDLPADDKKVLELLFDNSYQIGSRIALKDKTSIYTKVTDLGKQAYQDAIADGFMVDTTKIQKKMYIIGGIFVFISIFSLNALLLLAAIAILIAAYYMPARTPKGVELKTYLDGTKMYMEVAEAERLAMLQAPDTAITVDTGDSGQLVKLYERLLPLAMLYGIEKEWAKQFASLYTPENQPDWFVGNYASFNAIAFAGAMSNFGTSSTSSFSPPSSSGGSGFSGGGSSGGGGGGGGGGGW